MSKRVRTTRRLEVWLKDTSVALFVLNLQRRLVFFNVGCEGLTGWTPAEVMGQVCDYVTESDTTQPAALLASLAAPADVWQGNSLTVPILLGRRKSEPLACLIHFYPLTGAELKVQAVLGIIQQSPAPQVKQQLTVSQRLHLELASLRNAIRRQFNEESLIGRSPDMGRVMAQLKLAQQSSVPVLLSGESGAGREFIARLIHQGSQFGQRTFVPLDCRNLPADHLESTLNRMAGARFDDSLQPGTVYFNDVDGLPRDLQRQVAQMIASQSQTRVRFMAATTRSLEKLVAQDQFLNDLLLSLTPLSIALPPLRNRPDDLEPLAQFFLEEFNRGDSRQVSGFHDDVWRQFRRYDWPGNVRELREVVKQARNQSSGSTIEVSDLPFGFRVGVDRQSIGPTRRRQPEPLDELLLKVEREQIELALAEAKQNKAKAAELLGITRPRLYRRMEILGIEDSESAAQGDSVE